MKTIGYKLQLSLQLPYYPKGTLAVRNEYIGLEFFAYVSKSALRRKLNNEID
jgi:hypothetical protein